MEKERSLWQIFGIFAKIGAFTIGGGYAMIPIIENEMKKRGWIEESEIEDVVVLAQSAPGLLAVNMAIFTGYKLRGLKGAIVATLGAVLPSFLIILLVASVLQGFKDNPWVIKFFKGLRPVAVALILVPAINLANKSKKYWWAWIICIGTMIAVAWLKVSPVWILLCLLVVSISVLSATEGRRK